MPVQRDLPYELTSALETVGQTDFNGTIDSEKKFFGAHYRIMKEADGSDRLIGFNFAEQANSALVNVWEYDADFNMLHKTTREIKVSSHDLADLHFAGALTPDQAKSEEHR